MKRWVGAVTALVTAAAILPLLAILRLDMPINQVTATMTLAPTVDGRLVRVSGSTDLPDGARVFYYFWHERNDTEWQGGLPPYNVQGYAEVDRGSFDFRGDLSAWPPGSVTIWAEFEVVEGEQPDHILAVFGPKGERLGGPQASYADSEDFKQLHVETSVTIR